MKPLVAAMLLIAVSPALAGELTSPDLAYWWHTNREVWFVAAAMAVGYGLFLLVKRLLK